MTAKEMMKQTKIFVHGTTVAANMLIERNGSEIALVCRPFSEVWNSAENEP